MCKPEYGTQYRCELGPAISMLVGPVVVYYVGPWLLVSNSFLIPWNANAGGSNRLCLGCAPTLPNQDWAKAGHSSYWGIRAATLWYQANCVQARSSLVSGPRTWFNVHGQNQPRTTPSPPANEHVCNERPFAAEAGDGMLLATTNARCARQPLRNTRSCASQFGNMLGRNYVHYDEPSNDS